MCNLSWAAITDPLQREIALRKNAVFIEALPWPRYMVRWSMHPAATAQAISPADSGLVLLKTALTSDAVYSFAVTCQGGDIDYFQARVMSLAKATAGGQTGTGTDLSR